MSYGGPGSDELRDSLRLAFEANYASVLKLAYIYSGRREVAEDLTQEALLRAASKIAQLPAEEVMPYLRRTVINLWKNRIRRVAVERRARARLKGPAEVAAPADEPDAELWMAVRRLPPGQRACVVLRYYEDLSEQQVAETLGCSIGTVKSSTSRALSKLRTEFRDGS